MQRRSQLCIVRRTHLNEGVIGKGRVGRRGVAVARGGWVKTLIMMHQTTVEIVVWEFGKCL